MIRIAEVDENLEDMFWQHANQDPLEYYWFIVDWKYQKEDTRVLLALEDEEIVAMMLIFRELIVVLRGSPEAVESLLEHLDLEEAEMTLPLECKDMLLKRWEPKVMKEIVVMHLRKGDEEILKKHEPVRLSSKDAVQVSRIMRESYPIWWDWATPERTEKWLKINYVVGVKVDDKIVSLGSTRFVDFGSNIGVVATDEEHRNKGYATSVVSTLAEEILERSPLAIIHVLNDNHPAIHTYEKVGFRPYKSYLIVKKAAKINPKSC